ncbi:MAG: hypothetical protein ACN4E6_01540 [Qipengyuania pacifica]
MTGFLAAKHAIKGGILAIVAVAFLALAIFAGVQTSRIEGFHVWPVSMTGWKKTAQDRQATIDQLAAAQDLAAATAHAARVAQESTYRDIAERIDENAEDSIESAMAAADRFIANGGLRGQASGSQPCSARAASSDHRSEGFDGTGRATQLDASGAGDADLGEPTDGLVLVSAADVRICTRNTVKAEAGRDLAIKLEAASKPE